MVFSRPATRYSRPSSSMNHASSRGCKADGQAEPALNAPDGASGTGGSAPALFSLAASSDKPLTEAAKEREGAGALLTGALLAVTGRAPPPCHAAELSNNASDLSAGLSLQAYSLA